MGYFCHRCGQEWDRHPAVVVECPLCHAPPGSPCRRPGGHEAFGGLPHVARERLAVDQGLMPLCPAGPTAKRAARHGAGDEDNAPAVLPHQEATAVQGDLFSSS